MRPGATGQWQCATAPLPRLADGAVHIELRNLLARRVIVMIMMSLALPLTLLGWSREHGGLGGDYPGPLTGARSLDAASVGDASAVEARCSASLRMVRIRTAMAGCGGQLGHASCGAASIKRPSPPRASCEPESKAWGSEVGGWAAPHPAGRGGPTGAGSARARVWGGFRRCAGGSCAGASGCR